MVRLSISSKGAKIKVGRGGNIIPTDDGIPESLQPIGDSGFYRTPDVVSPGDCFNYPDSPLCGGNPISSKPAALSILPSVDSVGRTSLTISPTLLFFKLPSFTIMYAPPGTRGEFVPDKTPRTGTNKPALDNGDYGHLQDDNNYIISLDREGYYTIKLGCGSVSVGIASAYQTRQPSTISPPQTSNIVPEFPRPTVYTGGIPISEVYRMWIYDKPWSKFDDPPTTGTKIGELKTSSWNQSPYLMSGNGGLIKKYLSRDCGYYDGMDSDFHPGDFAHKPRLYNKGDRWIGKTKELESCREAPLTTAPPPYSPPEDCCMECCQSSPNEGKANDALLQKILKIVEKIDKNQGEYPSNFEDWDSDPNAQGIQKTQKPITTTREAIRFSTELSNRLARTLGIDLLPFTLPKTTVEKDNGGVLGDIWDFITPDETETITSVMDFFKWMVLNDSANMGQWQRVIEEEGVAPPPDPEGNQQPAPKQKIVLPDMATTMEESIRLDIRTQKNLGLMTDILIKLQLETAGIKTAVAQSLLRIEDVQEFLDYPTQEKSSKVPIQITVPSPNASQQEQNDLHKFEKPSEAYVRYDDWTGEESLRIQLIQLLQLSRYIKGNLTGQ